MKTFVYIKSILGYIWAVLSILVMVAGIMNLGLAKPILIDKYGAHISDNWTGGPVQIKKDYGPYSVSIHKPVFEGLIWDNKKGFIQIEWVSDKALTGVITEEVDYDKDGKIDFTVIIDIATNKSTLKKFDDRVLKVWDEGVLVYDKLRIIRIELEK